MYKKHQTPNSIINRTAYVWLRIKRERWVRGNANIYLWLKIIHKKIADHWLQIFHTEMAPTVCLSELPEARSPVVPFSRRLQRVSNGAIMKQQRLELRRIELNAANREVASLTPPDSPLWEAAYPHDFCAPSIVSSSSPIDRFRSGSSGHRTTVESVSGTTKRCGLKRTGGINGHTPNQNVCGLGTVWSSWVWTFIGQNTELLNSG